LATLLPWQRRGRGAGACSRPAGGLLLAHELAQAIGARTRVLAVTWVDSFTRRTLDLQALGGALCVSLRCYWWPMMALI